jgi:hypothetical protein
VPTALKIQAPRKYLDTLHDQQLWAKDQAFTSIHLFEQCMTGKFIILKITRDYYIINMKTQKTARIVWWDIGLKVPNTVYVDIVHWWDIAECPMVGKAFEEWVKSNNE